MCGFVFGACVMYVEYKAGRSSERIEDKSQLPLSNSFPEIQYKDQHNFGYLKINK